MSSPNDTPSGHPENETEPDEPHFPLQDYVVGVRYSLPAMLAELRAERFSGSFAMEKLDQKEIGKMFKPQKRRRAKSSE
jgi:hypothetical protein